MKVAHEGKESESLGMSILGPPVISEGTSRAGGWVQTHVNCGRNERATHREPSSSLLMPAGIFLLREMCMVSMLQQAAFLLKKYNLCKLFVITAFVFGKLRKRIQPAWHRGEEKQVIHLNRSEYLEVRRDLEEKACVKQILFEEHKETNWSFCGLRNVMRIRRWEKAWKGSESTGPLQCGAASVSCEWRPMGPQLRSRVL